MSNIVIAIATFFVVFFIGCVISLVFMVLSAEQEAEDEYLRLEDLEILDAITGGDDEE